MCGHAGFQATTKNHRKGTKKVQKLRHGPWTTPFETRRLFLLQLMSLFEYLWFMTVYDWLMTLSDLDEIQIHNSDVFLLVSRHFWQHHESCSMCTIHSRWSNHAKSPVILLVKSTYFPIFPGEISEIPIFSYIFHIFLLVIQIWLTSPAPWIPKGTIHWGPPRPPAPVRWAASCCGSAAASRHRRRRAKVDGPRQAAVRWGWKCLATNGLGNVGKWEYIHSWLEMVGACWVQEIWNRYW